MKTQVSTISVRTTRRLEVIDITREVESAVRKSGIKNGLVTVWQPHTTAALAVNEHDRDLWEDFLDIYREVAPLDRSYRHNEKYAGMPGEQNAHAHILNTMLLPSVTIPLVNGRLMLGTWQSVLFVEMDGPRHRNVYIHIMGE